jgi:hypothetical protein
VGFAAPPAQQWPTSPQPASPQPGTPLPAVRRPSASAAFYEGAAGFGLFQLPIGGEGAPAGFAAMFN